MEFDAIHGRLDGNESKKIARSDNYGGRRVRKSFRHVDLSFSRQRWHPSRSNTCCSDCCCSLDIWGIALNIILQDAPFLTFRLLIIIHYEIISYMNVFFTCKSPRQSAIPPPTSIPVSILGKNTLVILLQLYRLYVVQSESSKSKTKKKKLKYQQDRQRNSRGSRGHRRNDSSGDIYIISNEKSSKHKKRYEKDDGVGFMASPLLKSTSEA